MRPFIYKSAIASLLIILISSPPVASYIYGRQSSEISIFVSDTRVRVGDLVRISGRIKPPVSSAEVEIVYFRPDGSAINKTVTTFIFSFFEDICRPDVPGSWSAMASWKGNENYEGAISNVVSFTVEEPLEIRIW
ncbi:MAG: hypothetical protein QXG32_06625 [Candidatus Bathyarchaeia archaeon]